MVKFTKVQSQLLKNSLNLLVISQNLLEWIATFLLHWLIFTYEEGFIVEQMMEFPQVLLLNPKQAIYGHILRNH